MCYSQQRNQFRSKHRVAQLRSALLLSPLHHSSDMKLKLLLQIPCQAYARKIQSQRHPQFKPTQTVSSCRYCFQLRPVSLNISVQLVTQSELPYLPWVATATISTLSPKSTWSHCCSLEYSGDQPPAPVRDRIKIMQIMMTTQEILHEKETCYQFRLLQRSLIPKHKDVCLNFCVRKYVTWCASLRFS